MGSFGILALIEAFNSRSKADQNLFAVVDHKKNDVETYSELSLTNFIKHLKRNKDSKKIFTLMM